MVSDLSALLLLRYGIPCHKSSEVLHLRNNLGHKLERGGGGGGGGSAHARSAQLLMLMFYFLLLLMLNLQFNSSF